MANIGKAVDEFALQMKQLMYQHKRQGKAGWDYISLGEALQRINQELGEVIYSSIFVAMNYNDPEGWQDLQKELADVANFCMMLHHQANLNLERIKRIKLGE